MECISPSLPCNSTRARGVLQTEAGFVSLSDLFSSGFVEEVIVDEGFKGMVMTVTRVPDPFSSIQDGLEINCPPVICLTAESKESPINGGGCTERERA